MVYGESKTFDVDRVIDLLQALEKFVAVRDTGDGTAYKVDGVQPQPQPQPQQQPQQQPQPQPQPQPYTYPLP